MESPKKSMRCTIPLLKGRVVAKDGVTFKISIGGSTTITVTHNSLYMLDVREGDVLTLYTEVPLIAHGGEA